MVRAERILCKLSLRNVSFIIIRLLCGKRIIRIGEVKDAYIIYYGSLLENWAICRIKKKGPEILKKDLGRIYFSVGGRWNWLRIVCIGECNFY